MTPPMNEDIKRLVEVPLELTPDMETAFYVAMARAATVLATPQECWTAMIDAFTGEEANPHG